MYETSYTADIVAETLRIEHGAMLHHCELKEG